jgi:hypothetical protein
MAATTARKTTARKTATRKATGRAATKEPGRKLAAVPAPAARAERSLSTKQIAFLKAWAANPAMSLDEVCDLTGIGGKVPANRCEFAMRLIQRGALVLRVAPGAIAKAS